MTIDEGLNIALATGFVIDDRYAIEGVLGDGGFGIVYRAYDRTFETRVAIKEFLPREVSTRATDAVNVVPRGKSDAQVHVEGVKAFLEEARRLHRLHHENIVQVTDFIHAHGTGYLVMPYYNGETLRKFLERGETLSSAEIVDLVEQVLSALEYIHTRELLHRDISPGNLFLKKDGTVLLIDFGASRQVVGERSRSISTIVKPGYAPFEQYHASGKQGPWTDLYALGATLYRCVTGEAPPVATERADAVVESKPDPILQLAGSKYQGTFSHAILSLIDRLLAFQASSRPQSVASVRRLMPTTEDRTGSRPDAVPRRERPAPPEPASPPRSPRGKRALRFAIASIFAAAILAIGGPGLYERVLQNRGAAIGDDTGLPADSEPIPAPVPVPAPEPAVLVVRSNVADDLLFIDDRAVGSTGPERHAVSGGAHFVRVTKEYYADWSRSVTLVPGEERTLVAELALVPDSCRYAGNNVCEEPNLCPVGTDTTDCAIVESDVVPATLAVTSDPPSAQVFVDGDYLGATPLEAELDPGEYLVSVTGTDRYYADWVSPLTLTENEERTLAVELTTIPDSCEYANDDACDEPGLCPLGTDATDCAVSPANSCSFAFDGECDEPGLCPIGTDTADCSTVDSSNSCMWAFDGECDEPGLCAIGTDTADCSVVDASNSCTWAFDNACDEPGLCTIGTDTADCDAFFGDDSGTWANDGECDDPRFQGEGMATTLLESDRGRDATDCRNLYNAGSISER